MRFIRSLEFIFHLGWRRIVLRNRKALWKLHSKFPWGKSGTAVVVEGERRTPKQVSIIKFWTYETLGEIKKGSVVLDAGCNDGVVGRELVYQGCMVYGVDLSPNAVVIANYRGLFASVCPVEKLTFRDNFFDVCLAFEILEHLYNPDDGVRELYRVLKPEGVLIGSVPYPFGKFSHSSKYQHIYHQHDFTPLSIKQLLEGYFKQNKIKITQKKISNLNDQDKLFFRAVK